MITGTGTRPGPSSTPKSASLRSIRRDVNSSASPLTASVGRRGVFEQRERRQRGIGKLGEERPLLFLHHAVGVRRRRRRRHNHDRFASLVFFAQPLARPGRARRRPPRRSGVPSLLAARTETSDQPVDAARRCPPSPAATTPRRTARTRWRTSQGAESVAPLNPMRTREHRPSDPAERAAGRQRQRGRKSPQPNRSIAALRDQHQREADRRHTERMFAPRSGSAIRVAVNVEQAPAPTTTMRTDRTDRAKGRRARRRRAAAIDHRRAGPGERATWIAPRVRWRGSARERRARRRPGDSTTRAAGVRTSVTASAHPACARRRLTRGRPRMLSFGFKNNGLLRELQCNDYTACGALERSASVAACGLRGAPSYLLNSLAQTTFPSHAKRDPRRPPSTPA